MRILLKILTVLFLVILAVVTGIFIYLYTALPKKQPPVQVTIVQTPERLARGEYLARHVVVCVHCHSQRNMQYFATPSVPGTEGQGSVMFLDANGAVYAPNITPHGIGKWSDGEVLRAVTAGVTKDGDPLFAMMPYDVYQNLKQEDLYSVIAFIRTLKPIQHDQPRTQLKFPLKYIVRTMPHPPQPDVEAQKNPGHYLMAIAGCISCHTPIDDRHRPIPGMTLAGGQDFGTVRSANLTPDMETGIGKWTKQDFISTFKKWQDPALQHVEMPEGHNTVMPWVEFSGMKEEDLGAIYDYLRTVPPVRHAVQRFQHPS